MALIGGIEKRHILIANYDPAWANRFAQNEARIRQALGTAALLVQHVGSTSVPELAAKPIVDILLVVADSSDEPSYLPALTAHGFVLRVREPRWNEHRMLRTPEFDVHLHVFSRGCAEVERMLTFRDRLRSSANDRAAYESTKRRLAAQDWVDMNAYAKAKTDIIESIIARATKALHHP